MQCNKIREFRLCHRMWIAGQIKENIVLFCNQGMKVLVFWIAILDVLHMVKISL
jgi:hypothetical protein